MSEAGGLFFLSFNGPWVPARQKTSLTLFGDYHEPALGNIAKRLTKKLLSPVPNILLCTPFVSKLCGAFYNPILFQVCRIYFQVAIFTNACLQTYMRCSLKVLYVILRERVPGLLYDQFLAKSVKIATVPVDCE